MKKAKKKQEYYHVQIGLRGILIGWGICIIVLMMGFTVAAIKVADRAVQKEKKNAYQTLASYTTDQIKEKLILLQKMASETESISKDNRAEFIRAFEGIDGMAVYEQGNVISYSRDELLFEGFLKAHKEQLIEPADKQQLLMGTSSNSRYHVGNLQLGWITAGPRQNVLVSKTIDVTIDSECEFYIYYPENEATYPQGYLRPDFSAVREKLSGSNQKEVPNGTIRIPSYTVFFQKNQQYGYYGVLCVRDEALMTHFSGYFLMVLCALLFLMILLAGTYGIFKKKVYDPVIHVENAINGILNGTHGLTVEIDDNSELASAGLAINSMISHVENLTAREYQSEVLKRQAELNALQNQINPHFLYNTLESIRGLALGEGAKNAADMTKALANLFRYNIDNRNLTVTLQEELTNIDNYFVIQKYRFSNKIRLTIYIDQENPKLRQYQIPHMVLQPIVENAVCHGLETKRGGGTIMIMVMTTDSRMIITVKDDGLGMDDKTLERIEEQLQKGYTSGSSKERTGIALYNVNERIRILHGEDYGIHVYSTKGIGTEVEIVLPLVCLETTS